MGKIIGGGFPVGAVGGAAEVMAVFDPRDGKPKVPHGGTFTGNPITMAAGLASMRKMTRERFHELNTLGAYLREGLAEAMDGLRTRGQVTGRGSLFGVHLYDAPMRDHHSWYHSPTTRQRHGQLHGLFLEHGVLTAPALTGCLSTCMTEEDADQLIDTFSAALRKVDL